MLAVTHPEPGSVVLAERPMPVAGPGQVLVRVHAAGLNRADLLQCAGKYAAPPGWPADIPGLEYAGQVCGTGGSSVRWRDGDRVMGLVGGGAQAEFVAVHEHEAIQIPAGMSYTDAAAIPEAFLTGWDALVLRARAQAGERMLMHAVGSGVGTAVVQLGKLLGLFVIGTSRSADKLQRCAALGMDHGASSSDPSWPAQIGGPVDVIVDPLGAEMLDRNVGLLASRGRLVVLGTLTGSVAPAIDLGRVLRQRLEIIGTVMRTRESAERRELVAGFTQAVMPMFESGRLHPVVDRVFPMQEIAAAHALMQQNATFGKVVLSW